jgi:hypothetical protein
VAPHRAQGRHEGPDDADRVVDLTRDGDGRTRARLVDLVPGRTGKADTDPLFRIRNIAGRGAKDLAEGRRLAEDVPEAFNGIIELHRRIAHGYRNRDNYRLCEYSGGWSGIGWQGWRRSPLLACDSYRLWPRCGCRDADMSTLGGRPAPSRPTSVT